MAVYNKIFLLFAALCLAVSSAAPSENSNIMLKTPAECKDQEFCAVKPEGYDELEKEINRVLPKLLIKDYADRYGQTEETKLSAKDDWHNCPYVTTTQSMYLYNRGGNSSKTDVFVQTKLFKQYVDIVRCAPKYIKTESNEQCFVGMGVNAFHMKSTCVTTTAQRTLYVYDLQAKKVVQKSFDVPACCTCRVSYL